MASGVDVDRYSFRSLSHLLLFPYVRDGTDMRLIYPAELARLPLTCAYFERHEEQLRARERGLMDHVGWYAFSRTQNLGFHESPKLGVAATVRRLEVAADLSGSVYFHNVRVNGISEREGGPSLLVLLLLLNSRFLDWIFRRGAAEHANDYFAANKQFIQGLPIRIPDGSDLAAIELLGGRLHALSEQIRDERGGFIRWLASTVGTRSTALPGVATVERYDEHDVDEVIARLARDRRRLGVDPRERRVRELIEREHAASVDRVVPLVADLDIAQREADRVVYDLYRIPTEMQRLVDSEYER